MSRKTYHLSMELYCGVSALVDFPEGKTWDDVRSWFVKWDRLHVVFKDGSQHEFELNSDGIDAIDWKRPISVEVYGTDEDGHPNYEEQIDGYS